MLRHARVAIQWKFIAFTKQHNKYINRQMFQIFTRINSSNTEVFQMPTKSFINRNVSAKLFVQTTINEVIHTIDTGII